MGAINALVNAVTSGSSMYCHCKKKCRGHVATEQNSANASLNLRREADQAPYRLRRLSRRLSRDCLARHLLLVLPIQVRQQL